MENKSNDGKSRDTSKHYSSQKSCENSSKLSFEEWVKRKDAEKRMKSKLVQDIKNEIRQELFEIAQKEQLE